MRFQINNKTRIMKTLTMKSLTLKSFFIALTWLVIPLTSQAAPGIQELSSKPDYDTGKYIMRLEDMSVKVQGGSVRMVRTWEDGKWVWNKRWSPIELIGVEDRSLDTTLETSEPTGGTATVRAEIPNLPFGIVRNGNAYIWDIIPTDITHLYIVDRTFINGTTKRIEYQSGSYVWHDRLGNTITYDGEVFDADPDENKYDPRMRMHFYSDNNGNTVTLNRDASGRILTISAGGVGTIYTYQYDGDNISKITDYSGREVSYYYNAQDQLIRVNDVRGEDWLYEYDPTTGQLSATIDPTGHKVTLGINEKGVITSRQGDDGIGRTYQYGYTAAQDQYRNTQIDSSGTVTERWYNALGHVVRIDVNGELRYTVETVLSDNSTDVRSLNEDNFAAGKAILRTTGGGTSGGSNAVRIAPPPETRDLKYIKTRILTDARGEVTRYDYDQWQNIVKITYPDGGIETREYHLQYSLPVKITDESGTVTEYQYDAKGNLIQVIEAKGLPEERTTSYQYDANGNVIQVKVLGDANTVEASNAFTYDAYGNVATETDGEGNLTQYTAYDVLGNLKTAIDARNQSWSSTYDAAGNLLSGTDPDGRVLTYQYDGAGKLVQLIGTDNTETRLMYEGRLLKTLIEPAVKGTPQAGDPEGYSSSFEHDIAGRITKIVDPTGRSYQTQYDAFGRLQKVIDGGGNETRYNYTANQLKKVTYPIYSEDYEYDNRDDLISSTINANSQLRQQHWQYNREQRITTFTDAETHATQSHYDALGRIIKIIDAKSGEAQYRYDDRDNLIEAIDQEGRSTRFEYDKADRLVTEVKQQNNERTEYQYDATGNLKTILSANGEKTEFIYSNAGLLTSANYFNQASDPTPQKTISYSYNTVGLLSGYDDGATSASYEYDAQNRLTQVTINYGPFSKSYSYTYYPNGLKQSYTNPEGVTYQYTYDGNGQLASLTIPGEGQITINNYKWTAPAQITLPGGAIRTMDYDDTLRLIERLYKDPAQNTQRQAGYTYDNEDNIKTQTTEQGTYSYQYDELYRLTGADNPEGIEDESYTYDGVGNRLTTAEAGSNWQYNNNNQLSQITSDTENDSYVYDANGNLASKTVNGQTFTYIYNTEQRLIRVEDPANQPIAEYTYDPFGRRLSKTIGVVTTYFLYSQEGLVAEYDASGNLLTEYHYYPDSTWMTNPVFMRTNGQVLYYYNDHLGTPQALYTKTGQLKWLAEYNSFGEADIIVGDVIQNLRFPGQYYDQETGLHYNYLRYYDASIGRYLQTDPLGIYAGLNSYLYVFGRPLRYIDPLGLGFFDPIWGFVYDNTGWVPDQSTVDMAAGFGDGVSFGITKLIREKAGIDGGVNICSANYAGANLIGSIWPISGGAGLISKSFVKKAGKEWSHWIPDRYIRPRSLTGKNPNRYYKPWLDKYFGWFVRSRLNGSFVSSKTHYLTDGFRWPKGWDRWGRRIPQGLRQLGRTPAWIPGLGLVGMGIINDINVVEDYNHGQDACGCQN